MANMSMLILPEEIRGMIFNYIPQKESLKLRLVCKNWNQDVQNYFKFIIENLDEDSPNFKLILQLQIKELTIYRLETTPVFTYLGQPIFKYPNSVRKLVVKSNAIVAGLNLQLMIGLFSKKLRVLEINLTPEIYNKNCPSDLWYDFKNLAILHLRSIFDPNQSKCEDNPNSLLQVLENSSFPKLEKFDVLLARLKMGIEAKGRIFGNLFRIISKHGKSIRHLQLIVNPELKLDELTYPLEKDELDRIKQLDMISMINLFFVESVGPFTKEFWTEFLLNQKHLMHLIAFPHSSFHHVSVPILEQIILKNYRTLQKLNLELKFSPTDEAFDLSILKHCSNLNQLTLSLRQFPRTNIEGPDVKNFHGLPENITTLSITNLRILSTDLLNAFLCKNTSGTKGFEKLEELNLWSCGTHRFGINAVVFYEIMMSDRPNLTRVDFSHERHQQEFSFKTVLNQLNVPEYARLRLKRDSPELGWVSY